MMKRILLILGFVLFASPAMATCLSGATPAGTATLKDAAGTPNTFTTPYSDDGSGNCIAPVVVSNGANKMAVKAASTAAAQTDPAGVVRNPDLGTIGDAAWSSGNGTLIALSKAIAAFASTTATNTGAAIPAGTNTIGNVGLTSQYPVGATAITASATGTTAATTATLAGTSGKTTYICGYSIRANATAATTVTDTITGVITATLSSILWVAPLASGIGVDEQIFSPCIPASATNTGIAIVSGAPGSGGTVSSKGWGYQL
jgi:hypothetical protein